MNEKLARTIDEFCDLGNLEDYREVIAQIFKEIEADGCKIAARTDGVVSQHEHNANDCIMRISLVKDHYTKPIEIIWTILHEFGHHQDPLRKEDENDSERRLQSEEKAWSWAESKLDDFKELLAEKDSFLNFKQKCLHTYSRFNKQ